MSHRAAAWPTSVAIDTPDRPDRPCASPDAAELSSREWHRQPGWWPCHSVGEHPRLHRGLRVRGRQPQRGSPGGLGTWRPGLGAPPRLHRLPGHYGRVGPALAIVRKGRHDDSVWRRAVVRAFGCETGGQLIVRLGADTSAGAATWTISGSPSGRPVAAQAISYPSRTI